MPPRARAEARRSTENSRHGVPRRTTTLKRPRRPLASGSLFVCVGVPESEQPIDVFLNQRRIVMPSDPSLRSGLEPARDRSSIVASQALVRSIDTVGSLLERIVLEQDRLNCLHNGRRGSRHEQGCQSGLVAFELVGGGKRISATGLPSEGEK